MIRPQPCDLRSVTCFGQSSLSTPLVCMQSQSLSVCRMSGNLRTSSTSRTVRSPWTAIQRGTAWRLVGKISRWVFLFPYGTPIVSGQLVIRIRAYRRFSTFRVLMKSAPAGVKSTVRASCQNFTCLVFEFDKRCDFRLAYKSEARRMSTGSSFCGTSVPSDAAASHCRLMFRFQAVRLALEHTETRRPVFRRRSPLTEKAEQQIRWLALLRTE